MRLSRRRRLRTPKTQKHLLGALLLTVLVVFGALLTTALLSRPDAPDSLVYENPAQLNEPVEVDFFGEIENIASILDAFQASQSVHVANPLKTNQAQALVLEEQAQEAPQEQPQESPQEPSQEPVIAKATPTPAPKKAKETVKVDANAPFLQPNKVIKYTQEAKAVALAEKLCKGLKTDSEKVNAIYKYIWKNLSYDYERANQVMEGKLNGYLPDIDDVLAKKKGICFDYSALMACMLRAQGIPTKLVMGYADKVYHAWNLVLIDGAWIRYDATFASTRGAAQKYTALRYY